MELEVRKALECSNRSLTDLCNGLVQMWKTIIPGEI